tara:strand:- start:45935 stop:47368 length:1434 start_codon:yes stop_codon:yes gene_type:complete
MALTQVLKTYYNDQQMTDTNSLVNALMEKPEELSPIITHLAGREEKKFPLSFMTEGVGNTRSIDRFEYEYRVKTHEVNVRPVSNVTNLTAAQGANGQLFKLTFPDKFFIFPYTLVSQSGVLARIMDEPKPVSGGYEYTLRLVSPDQASMPAADVANGALFGMLFASVGIDFSRGNASNWTAPGLVRSKIGTVRKSYHMSGNAKDYVAQFELPLKEGSSTKLWMDYEEYRHMLKFKEECEMYYWYGQKTYGSDGVNNMIDENGQPVLAGPGLFEQIINKDTYSTLTQKKIENTIGDLFYGMTDATDKQVTLFTGIGGAREFDRALRNYYSDTNNRYLQTTESKFITGSGRSLGITGYFTSYDHIDGHRVNVVKVPLFDHGPVAQASKKHPETGLPLESYRMTFVDQSSYDGENNLQMINKKGREMLRWCVAGSVVPKGFAETDTRASDIDGASVHMLKTAGILLRRFDTSLDLQCVAS